MASLLPAALLALSVPHEWSEAEVGHLLLVLYFRVYSWGVELIPAPHQVP